MTKQGTDERIDAIHTSFVVNVMLFERIAWSMYDVLVPVDSSTKRAERAATTVAAYPNSDTEIEVILLNVFEEFDVTGEGRNFSSDEVYEANDFPESVSVAETVLENAGITASKRREHGEPAETILDVAQEIDADNIVMCGRKRSPTGKVIFGSVAQSVLLESNRPVTLTVTE